MTSRIKLGNVVLCEYFVQGLGNKHTLINVYSGDIVVAEMPAKMRLALYIEYEAMAEDAFSVRLEVLMSKEVQARFRFDVESGPRGRHGIMALPNMEIGIDENVAFEVRMSLDGERSRTVLKKAIAKGAVA